MEELFKLATDGNVVVLKLVAVIAFFFMLIIWAQKKYSILKFIGIGNINGNGSHAAPEPPPAERKNFPYATPQFIEKRDVELMIANQQNRCIVSFTEVVTTSVQRVEDKMDEGFKELRERIDEIMKGR